MSEWSNAVKSCIDIDEYVGMILVSKCFFLFHQTEMIIFVNATQWDQSFSSRKR